MSLTPKDLVLLGVTHETYLQWQEGNITIKEIRMVEHYLRKDLLKEWK